MPGRSRARRVGRSKSMRERASGRATKLEVPRSREAPAGEQRIYQSQLMVKFSKPSFSIYLDYSPRDKCFKVAYIVEGESAPAFQDMGGGGV